MHCKKYVIIMRKMWQLKNISVKIVASNLSYKIAFHVKLRIISKEG
jgi:hypothetical protein